MDGPEIFAAIAGGIIVGEVAAGFIRQWFQRRAMAQIAANQKAQMAQVDAALDKQRAEAAHLSDTLARMTGQSGEVTPMKPWRH